MREDIRTQANYLLDGYDTKVCAFKRISGLSQVSELGRNFQSHERLAARTISAIQHPPCERLTPALPMMASRSFKPVSYLATAAAHQSQKSGGAVRPGLNHATSASSSMSDDSALVHILENVSTSTSTFTAEQPHMGDGGGKLKMEEKVSRREGNPSGGDYAFHPSSGPTGVHETSSPSSSTNPPSRSSVDDEKTPERRGSQPIAIQLPSRDRHAVYTPLSARGDLPGGYFPNHEEITRAYKCHPFSSHINKEESSDPDTPFEMSMSALGSPVSAETTPRGPQTLLSPTFGPESVTVPLGKYHPSNYKSSVNPVKVPVMPPSFPSGNLTIPKSTGKRSSAGRPGHERKTSDVKKKIQQYQRDMIAQARLVGLVTTPGSGAMTVLLKEPISPRLEPAGSPGPITPFELEESAGYLVAGSSSRVSLVGIEVEVERQRELPVVENLIRREEQRRDGFPASLRV